LARPFRYTFILVLAALSIALAALSGWRYARASAPVSGPILLISIDALRADHLGPYGYTERHTPAIDSLAADGIVFERAYSHVPQTLPAHATLLTGRLPFETGIRDGVGPAIPESERLLPEMLRDRGFATGGVVSSFLLRSDSGINQGFDFYDAELSSADVPQRLSRDGLESVRIAERWLGSIGTTRAFLFVHLDEPRTRRVDSDRPELSPYDAGIASADSAVGHLVRYLKAHQLYDRSTIILLSDHGEGLGDHGEQRHGLFVYDDTLRIPLIIKPPAGQGAGHRTMQPVQHVDLAPTILDLAKAPAPANLRGRSLTPLFDGNGSIAETTIYGESWYGLTHFGWSDLTSIVDGRYRYIHAPREELYDLIRDPGERDNIAAQNPEIVRQLRAKLKAFASQTATIAGPAVASRADRERYEAFGYVGEPSARFVGPRELIDPKDTWDVVERYRHGIDLAQAHDWPAAIETLRSLARDQPSMVDLWGRLASTATKGERHDIAADAYKQIVQREPDNHDALLGAAAAFLRLRRFDDARQLAQRAADLAASSPQTVSAAHELLARVALARRNVPLARSEAALADNGDDEAPVAAYIEGRIAFDERKYDRALELFEGALAAPSKQRRMPPADLALWTAETLLRLERFPEAEYLFQLELTEAPLSARARAGLAAVYLATGRGNEAAALAAH
jgi:tetratricopeptide (TPR) repeat protein